MQPSPITPANLLTFSRLVFLPVVIVGIAARHGYVAVVAMGVILITDLLDGRIARRLGQATAFGKSFDSTVDFVLIYALFIAFYAAGRLATWQFGFLYLAMVTIFLLQFALIATGKGEEVANTALGKVTGALQYGYLLFLVAREVLPARSAVSVADTVFFGVLACAIVLNSIQCVARIRTMLRAAEGR
jgi:phosphatidylglycerophosphate synthase